MEFLYVLEELRTPWLDAIVSALTHLGGETVFLIAALTVFWCVDKRQGYYLMSVGFMGTLVNQFLKITCRIPRPWVRDPGFTIVESARAEATGYSFPSGHTQSSVGIFGALARWNKQRWLRLVCILLCVLVPLSRLYLGVHTPADVGVSLAIALALVLVLCPLLRRAKDSPALMRGILLAMLLLAGGYLAFVSLYPFPADVDAANLASGTKNAYTMLGCMAGLWLTYEVDVRRLKFDTQAPLAGQALKLALGFGLLLAIKAGAKAPLRALFANDYLADGIRYFLMVAFAGCIWPLTFRFSKKLGKK
jgi:undecaprenyl-diphosphatase